MAGLIRRKKWYYAVYLIGGKERRKALGTTSHRVAKAELKKLELRLSRDEDDLFPTKTPLPDVVAAYAEHISHTKTRSGFRVDCWYLRDIFGPVCDILQYDDRGWGKRRCRKRRSAARIEVRYIENLATRDISEFIGERMKRDDIAPKTGNRYREIVTRLVNWCASQNLDREEVARV